jgi:hypothetical protein
MADLPFKLECFARAEDGLLRPFSLEISEPQFHDEFGYSCEIQCPTIRTKPMKIYGHEPLFAAELSVQFVKLSLGHLDLGLVDEEGSEIDLPKYDDLPEKTGETLDVDGARETEGVLVSLKDIASGHCVLCLDDIEQTQSGASESWGNRVCYTWLPIEEEIPEELYAQIGWNIVTRVRILRAAAKKKPSS